MKILHCADLHHDILATRLGKWKIVNGVNVVYQERLERTRDIIYTGLREGVDVFVIAGDLFNRPKPFPQEYCDIEDILKLIPEDKFVIVTSGNHDEKTARGCALDPLEGIFPNVFVTTSLDTIHVLGYDFIVAPYGTRLEDIRALRATYIDRNPILIYHTGTAIPGQFWTELNEEEVGAVPLQDLIDLDCLAVMLGHYHGQVQLDDGIWYCGSPEIFNFGERDQEKGFLIWEFYTSDIHEIQRVKTEYPSYIKLTPEQFLQPQPEVQAYVFIQGEVTEETRSLVLEKLKTFGCFGVKLDLKSTAKEQKVFMLKGKSNREVLTDYLTSKKLEVTDELLTLDNDLEKLANAVKE